MIFVCAYSVISTIVVGLLCVLVREQENKIIKLESDLDSLHTSLYESERVRYLHSFLDRGDREQRGS